MKNKFAQENCLIYFFNYKILLDIVEKYENSVLKANFHDCKNGTSFLCVLSYWTFYVFSLAQFNWERSCWEYVVNVRSVCWIPP